MPWPAVGVYPWDIESLGGDIPTQGCGITRALSQLLCKLESPRLYFCLGGTCLWESLSVSRKWSFPIRGFQPQPCYPDNYKSTSLLRVGQVLELPVPDFGVPENPEVRLFSPLPLMGGVCSFFVEGEPKRSRGFPCGVLLTHQPYCLRCIFVVVKGIPHNRGCPFDVLQPWVAFFFFFFEGEPEKIVVFLLVSCSNHSKRCTLTKRSPDLPWSKLRVCAFNQGCPYRVRMQGSNWGTPWYGLKGRPSKQLAIGSAKQRETLCE